jgi:hypothetical protein
MGDAVLPQWEWRDDLVAQSPFASAQALSLPGPDANEFHWSISFCGPPNTFFGKIAENKRQNLSARYTKKAGNVSVNFPRPGRVVTRMSYLRSTGQKIGLNRPVTSSRKAFLKLYFSNEIDPTDLPVG